MAAADTGAFNKEVVAREVRQAYPAEEAEFVLAHIPDDELRTLCEDASFFGIRDYLPIASTNACSDEEFAERSSMIVRNEWKLDYHRFTIHWARDAERYDAWNLGIRLGRPPNEDELRDSFARTLLTNELRSVSRKCRVVYSFMHPERMERYSPPAPTLEEHVCAA